MKWSIRLKKILCLGILFVQISAQSVASTTAHFGEFQIALAGLTLPPTVGANSPLGYQYSYLQNHVLPTVTRLASVCSIDLSKSSHASLKGLMHMKGENVGTITSYDTGVIVAIQNNTRDQLTINQISTVSKNQIGSLDATSTSNYFLHTASLMPASTALGLQDPVPGNMIEIANVTVGASVYFQVISGTQLQSFVTSVNAVLNKVAGTTGNAFAYNQQSGASSGYAPAGQYLLFTNFNPSSLSSSLVEEDLLMYRMQCVDISQFLAKPYCVTLQINKENLGYGILENELTMGSSSKSILYPSIVSIKTLIMQNPYDKAFITKYPHMASYNSIPLLMIPKNIFEIPGIKTPYNAWYQSYAKAVIGDSSIWVGTDYLDPIVNKYIGLFDMSKQQPPARVVIDASGNLKSGVTMTIVDYQNYSEKFQQIESSINSYDQTIHTEQGIYYNITQDPNWVDPNDPSNANLRHHDDLVNAQNATDAISVAAQHKSALLVKEFQTQNMYMSLMGCDVIDIGSNYHQDIPILNLYKSTSGSVVANQVGGDWINLSVTFGSPATLSGSLETFTQGYGVPYNNVMLFSLPTSDIAAGVIGELSQTSAGNYELIFKDQNSNVLAVQKVFLDASIQNPTSIKIQFLNSTDTGWTSSALIPQTVASVLLGTTHVFTLQYGASGNTLKAQAYTVPATYEALTTQIPTLTGQTLSASYSGDSFAPASFNIKIGDNVGYAFFSNPWPGKSQIVTGLLWADISPYLRFGIAFVLLCFDINQQLILDVTKTIPVTMQLLIYTRQNGSLVKSVPIDPIKNATILSGTSVSYTSNTITSAGLNLTSVVSEKYPVAFSVIFDQSAPAKAPAISTKSPIANSSVVTTKLEKKTTKTGASPATPLVKKTVATASKNTTEIVTSAIINTLKQSIQSLDTKVKAAVKLATDKYEKRDLNLLDKKTEKLLKKVKPGITAEQFVKMQKQYKKLKKDLSNITLAS